MKSFGLWANRLVGPLVRRLGIDTKGAYEYAYWKTRFREEQRLRNGFYPSMFTAGVGVGKDFYAGQRVLDIGCGPRGSLEWARRAESRVGLDPLASRYRNLGTAAHEMDYVSAGSESMPFRGGCFDIVTTINSLDHVEDVEASLDEMGRVLRPGGSLIVVVDIHRRPTIAEPHAIPWDLGDQLQQRTDPGFDVVHEEHLEKAESGARLGTPAFDHDDPTDRYGVLVLRAVKR